VENNSWHDGGKPLKTYLVHGKRTPFGRFSGTLKDITPVDLSVISSKATLSDLSLEASKIDHLVYANVLPSTTDTLYGGRHISLKLGMNQDKPAYNVNRLCGSGIQALWEACSQIKLNESDLVMATGSENMSMAPHLIYGSRFGTKYGPLKTVDLLMDSLTDQYAGCPMGVTAENLAKDYKLARNNVDQFALDSHAKATKAYTSGLLADEISVLEGICSRDEHVRAEARMEEMAKLRPSFQKDGIVTAANASGIVDGAASILVASEKSCEKNGLSPLAEILGFAVVGVDPSRMGIGPVPAIERLLQKHELKIGDIDLFEINEAFAPQVMACQTQLEIPLEKLNIWGGAIAYGHPLGASGVRIALTLARQLKMNKLKLGVAAACIGGGQGIAILLRSVE
jgi:acetyl-CoA acyltransferase 2